MRRAPSDLHGDLGFPPVEGRPCASVLGWRTNILAWATRVVGHPPDGDLYGPYDLSETKWS